MKGGRTGEEEAQVTSSKEIIGLKDGTICKGDGYGQEVDVWALGVLTYMLVSGMPPFNGKTHADVIWQPACDSAWPGVLLGVGRPLAKDNHTEPDRFGRLGN